MTDIRYKMPDIPDKQLIDSLKRLDRWYNYFRNSYIKSYYLRHIQIPTEPVMLDEVDDKKPILG